MKSWPLTNYKDILAAVKKFDERKYAGTRNFIDGDVSRLSPYISRGCISTKLVFDAIVTKNPKAARGKFVQELLWRDYFQRLLQERPDLKNTPVKNKSDNGKPKMPKAVYDANTGIDAVDEAILELYETGYMHNHFRMYTAALCCNMARFGFQVPGTWLYYHLLDADIASNFASWQWVSGHLTNRKYIANQDNINRYSKQEQRGTFLDKSYEDLERMRVPKVLSGAIEPHLSTKLPNTDLPKLKHSSASLYTIYNLDPKWHARKKCDRVLILEPAHFEQYPIGEKVLDFILKLSENIKGLQLYCGSFADLSKANPNMTFTAKEHPILQFENAIVEPRDWIVPEVSGYFQSFAQYYQACLPYLIERSK